MEQSVLIAWDYLERTGDLGDPAEAGQFLMDHVEREINKGTLQTLLLSNRAITSYRNRNARNRTHLEVLGVS